MNVWRTSFEVREGPDALVVETQWSALNPQVMPWPSTPDPHSERAEVAGRGDLYSLMNPRICSRYGSEPTAT